MVSLTAFYRWGNSGSKRLYNLHFIMKLWNRISFQTKLNKFRHDLSVLFANLLEAKWPPDFSTNTFSAAAKSRQSCLTLCDPIDGSPPGSRPWDSPGKNTGVSCHFLLQCMKVKSESEVAQSCLTLSDPMDRSLPSSSVHGTFQARVLEWVAMPSSRESSQPRARTQVSCRRSPALQADSLLTEPPGKP